MLKKEINDKVKQVIEFYDTVLGKVVCKELTGVDGSLFKKYLIQILNDEHYNKNTVIKNLLKVRDGLKRLGYRYEEIANMLDDIISYLRGKRK